MQLINLHVKNVDHTMEMERQQTDHAMEMERKLVDHTMEMERKQQATDRKADSQGQWMTFILVLAALLTVAVAGNPAAGLVTIPVAGLPIVYIAFRAWEKRKLRSTPDTAAGSSEAGGPIAEGRMTGG